MKVLIACEESQTVCKAFRERGHEAYSNDIIECSGGHPEWHIQANVRLLFNWPHKYTDIEYWDLVIAFTPCTFQANSGVRWLFDTNGNKINDRWDNLELTLSLFNSFDLYRKQGKIGKLAKENPIPHRYARDGFLKGNGLFVKGMGDYTQLIQPWQFGHGETKATCLWLYDLPKLQPTNIVDGREQRIWKLPPSSERAKLRSKTYEGIARAMAEQWG